MEGGDPESPEFCKGAEQLALLLHLCGEHIQSVALPKIKLGMGARETVQRAVLMSCTCTTCQSCTIAHVQSLPSISETHLQSKDRTWQQRQTLLSEERCFINFPPVNHETFPALGTDGAKLAIMAQWCSGDLKSNGQGWVREQTQSKLSQQPHCSISQREAMYLEY